MLGILAAVRSLVQGVLALQAAIPEHLQVSQEIMSLATRIDRGLRMAADSLGGKSEAPRLPDLRDAYVQVTAVLGLSRPEASELSIDDRLVTLAGKTDLIVDSVNTIGHLVGMTPDH